MEDAGSEVGPQRTELRLGPLGMQSGHRGLSLHPEPRLPSPKARLTLMMW